MRVYNLFHIYRQNDMFLNILFLMENIIECSIKVTSEMVYTIPVMDTLKFEFK